MELSDQNMWGLNYDMMYFKSDLLDQGVKYSLVGCMLLQMDKFIG